MKIHNNDKISKVVWSHIDGNLANSFSQSIIGCISVSETQKLHEQGSGLDNFIKEINRQIHKIITTFPLIKLTEKKGKKIASNLISAEIKILTKCLDQNYG